MAELNYDGDIVNSSVQSMSNIVEKFTNLANAMQHATNTIVSARGFNEYIGGISTDSFSSQVNDCQTVGQAIISQIQQGQIQILSYSEDDEEIQAFLDTLDRVDYKNLDLTGIEDHISFGRKAANFFGGLFSDVGAGVLGLAEGLFEFGETGADLVVTGFSTLASIGTSIYDGMTGDNLTDRLQASTRTFVSNKLSENLFNSIYANTEVGRYIKKNAYGFDTVRNVTKGLGYVAGMVGLTAVTGGAATAGLAGSVSAGNLALTAGAFGFASGAEQAWSEGATHSKGLMYGGANAAWEATQWYLGAKIAGIGGMGEGSHIANGIFRSGAGARIGLDTVDSAAEGFVQPALTMIYKNYDGDNFFEKYANAFEANGGWGAVGTNALIGGFGSFLGEIGDARKLLKDNNKASAAEGEGLSDVAQAKEIFASSAEEGAPKRLPGKTLGETPLLPESVPSPTKVLPGETLDDALRRSGTGSGPVIVSDKILKENNIRVRGESQIRGGGVEPGAKIVYNRDRGEYLRIDKDGYATKLSKELFTSDGLYRGEIRVARDDVHGVWRDQITGAETPINPRLSDDSTIRWQDTHAGKHILTGSETGKAVGLHKVDTFIDRMNNGEIFLYKDGEYFIKSGSSIGNYPGATEISKVVKNVDGSLTVFKADSSSFRIEPNSEGLVSVRWGNKSSAKTLKPAPGSTFYPFDWGDTEIKESIDGFLSDADKRPMRIQVADTKAGDVFVDNAEYRFEFIHPTTKRKITMGVQINGPRLHSIYPIDVDLITESTRPNTYIWEGK